MYWVKTSLLDLNEGTTLQKKTHFLEYVLKKANDQFIVEHFDLLNKTLDLG